MRSRGQTVRSSASRSTILSLAVSFGGCAHSFTAADEQAIRTVLATQSSAWNRGDLDGFMAGYEHSPDLVFTSGGNIRHGFDETITKYKAKYGTDKSTMGHLAFELLSIQHLGADGAIVLGKWALTETPNEGAGIFSVAFERTSAGWLIVHDHTSANPK
jgi:ketosteroid isomerase-like protein